MRIRFECRGHLMDIGGLSASGLYNFDERRILTEVARRLRQMFAENFTAGGRPAWPPLAQSTVRQKTALFMAGKIRGRNVRAHLVPLSRPQPTLPNALFILIRTGKLRNSVVRRGIAGNITRINTGAHELTVGTSVFYGMFHQEGTSKMPARPFLTITEQEEEDLIDLIIYMALNPEEFMAQIAA